MTRKCQDKQHIVYIVLILYIVIFCWILYYFLAVHECLWLLVTERGNKSSFKVFCFGLSNFNITSPLHMMLNFVGQHHTSWIFFMHLLIIRAIFKEFIHHLTHKFYIFLCSLQVKCEIFWCINSLKLWFLTVWERFKFQETEKK